MAGVVFALYMLQFKLRTWEEVSVEANNFSLQQALGSDIYLIAYFSKLKFYRDEPDYLVNKTLANEFDSYRDAWNALQYTTIRDLFW